MKNVLLLCSFILLFASCSFKRKDSSIEDRSISSLSNEKQSNVELFLDNDFFDNSDKFSNEYKFKISDDLNNEEMILYQVRDSDTYMTIAFEIYGDYSQWSKIRDLNKGHKYLKEGVTIKMKKPNKFYQRPEGFPYLVKEGDSLVGISTKVYSTPKYWSHIWHNNSELIKDPNVIFAGFIIFYPDKKIIEESSVKLTKNLSYSE